MPLKSAVRLEVAIANLAMTGKPFLLLTPDLVYRQPVYDVDPDDLQIGEYVGHTVQLPDGPTFVVSKILDRQFRTDEHMALGWPSHFITELVLHSWDKRKLSECPVQQLTLVFNHIQCLLKKVGKL